MADEHVVEVELPVLSELGIAGQQVFQNRCTECHGENGGGTEQGPPLIHRIYEPSHHADIAFVRAIQNGSRAHHWPFGDMPPVEGLSAADIQAVIAFVREVQAAHGIE